MLEYLVERQDRMVSRAELLSDVWGHTAARGSNVVDATVKLLRHKLGARASSPQTKPCVERAAASTADGICILRPVLRELIAKS